MVNILLSISASSSRLICGCGLLSEQRVARPAWLFAGSDRGGKRAATMYFLIATGKLNDLNPQAWLADVLTRIADHPAGRLAELLPWHLNRRHNHTAVA